MPDPVEPIVSSRNEWTELILRSFEARAAPR